MFRTLYPPSSRFGTTLVCWTTKPGWKPASHLHITGHRCSQLLKSTVATGSLHCQCLAWCGLRLPVDDEAVRVAVGLRLGLDLCIPHHCNCGSAVDSHVLHNFVCKIAPGRSARHHVPWQIGKSLCWNVTVTCPLAESYIDRAALEAGSSRDGSHS